MILYNTPNPLCSELNWIDHVTWSMHMEETCFELRDWRVVLRTQVRREKNIEHYELRGSIELRTLGLICVWTYFTYVVPVIGFLYWYMYFKKLQRAELFSKFSIPQDTQFISTILGENEQCFPNTLLNNKYTVNAYESTFRFSEISAHDVTQAKNQIKTTKSVGIDKISTYFLKIAIPYVSKSIAQLLNISIRNSIFPDSWKTARLTPIFKEGDKSEWSNERPFLILPVLTRIFKNWFLISYTNI